MFNEHGVSIWGAEKVLDVTNATELYIIVNVTNATELYIKKWLKWQFLCCIYFPVIFKN